MEGLERVDLKPTVKTIPTVYRFHRESPEGARKYGETLTRLFNRLRVAENMTNIWLSILPPQCCLPAQSTG